MIRRPPRATRTDTLFPYTTLFRSEHVGMQVLSQLAFTSGFDSHLDRSRAEAPALLADKYRVVGRVGQRSQRQPQLQRLPRFAPNRQPTFLAPLAQHLAPEIGRGAVRDIVCKYV